MRSTWPFWAAISHGIEELVILVSGTWVDHVSVLKEDERRGRIMDSVPALLVLLSVLNMATGQTEDNIEDGRADFGKMMEDVCSKNVACDSTDDILVGSAEERTYLRYADLLIKDGGLETAP